ncbi:MAG: formate dehydrogenase accessory protein FdhE [Deltaproteobacteria bacterium]|nr:formate dehydrogenase accessory protein FdhE [Deltaproteobacteria bacterium]
MTTDILHHIDRLIKQRPAAREILETYRNLIEQIAEVETGETDMDIRVDRAAVKLKEGFPLFSRDDLPIDLKAAAIRLSRCLDHLSRQDREDLEGLKMALERIKSEPNWPEDVFIAALKENEDHLKSMAEDVGLDPGVLLFLAKVALAPSMKALRAAVSNRKDGSEWDQGFCPVCGSPPDMACFTKTGARYLHCELCGDEWRYPRMKCPFCENEDHNTLGYFQAKEEEGFRVYFCHKCKRYIKTMDKSVFEEPAPLDLEYMATLHLDLVASEHGFS